MRKFLSKAYDATVHKAKHIKARTKMALAAAGMFMLSSANAAAQSLAGTGYDAGTSAMEEVASEIVKYVPFVVNLCYAIAGVVAIVGAISVYISMNNEEQDVKKKIMMIVGACIFLIAAANALPLFFGITN
jgi:type IV secretory pathway VirB2 component (pilin)